MIQKVLNVQTKSVSFASLILMGSYLISAGLGLMRDRLLAGRFGAGSELDAYYAAFAIPDFIVLILIFGAISAAIVPIFSSYIVKSKEEAWLYISALFNAFLTFLIIICFLLIIFAPYFVSLIAPGFSQDKQDATALLMRVMFLSPIILGISNIISGILQVFHKFLVTAFAPIMYNLGIIFGILFLVPQFGLLGLAFGVVLGAILHLLIQVPSFYHSGFRYTLIKSGKSFLNIMHPGVIKTLKLMAPRSLGLGASQFNRIVIVAIASTLVSGSVAIFNLAGNLSSILVNAIAASLSTAVFPPMSLAYLNNDKEDFERKFSGAFCQIMFLIIPASFLIFILRAQIVRVVLGTGKFDWIDTRLTAACLGIFSIGLCAQGLIFILSKTFYASHNTKIPALTSVVTVILNILLSLILVRLLNFSGAFFNFVQYLLRLEGIKNISIIGLSIAFSATVIIQALLLLFFLYRKFKIFKIQNISIPFYKILISSLAMSIVTFLVRDLLVNYHFIKLQTFLEVFLQLILSGLAGIIVYILISYLLKSHELKKIKELFFELNNNARPN